jgi:hypothetical protein
MVANYIFNGNGDRDRFLQRIKVTVDDRFRLGTTDTTERHL